MYKRGDVYMMDLNPYSGSEQGGIRPAIVVQNDDGNFYSNVLLVVPLTTQIKKRNMPTHFILHNRFLSAPSMAICESPRPADKSRVLSYLGHLSKYEMRQVSVCLQYSFGFIGFQKRNLSVGIGRKAATALRLIESVTGRLKHKPSPSQKWQNCSVFQEKRSTGFSTVKNTETVSLSSAWPTGGALPKQVLKYGSTANLHIDFKNRSWKRMKNHRWN